MRRQALLWLTVIAAGAAAAAGVAQAAPSDAASWGKMSGFGLGMLQDAVYQQHGFGTSGGPKFFTSYRVEGGRVDLMFKHGRVTDLNCSAPGPLAGGGCPTGFTLPDGTSLGTKVPYRSPWHGYSRYTPQEPQYDFYYWRKSVRSGGRIVHVYLITERGKVTSIAEATS
jgi:hypothetical protein